MLQNLIFNVFISLLVDFSNAQTSDYKSYKGLVISFMHEVNSSHNRL